MKFVDWINIKVIAGTGGNGCISFERRKRREFLLGKPDGSDGGNGGNVWLQADTNVHTLGGLLNHRIFKAEDGKSGSSRNCTGRRGSDLFVRVPWGTRVYYQYTKKLIGELGCNRKFLLVAKGGLHGIGNKNFSSFVRNRRSIYQKLYGSSGEDQYLFLELILQADVGIIGLSNSGRSSFIRKVSSAKPKVADYPYTTLFPCLGTVQTGVYERFIIVDIPSIVKGREADKSSLGVCFFKHLEHCRLLLHFVDIQPNDNSDPVQNIIDVENELCNYNNKLIYKPCWLVFNKIDILKKYELERKINYILRVLKWKKKYFCISSKYATNISKLCKSIMRFICYKSN